MTRTETASRIASIRPATPQDRAGMLAVVVATGLFAPGEMGEVETLLDEHFAGGPGPDHAWLVDDDGQGPAAVAYYAPERMTNGTWNLYLIAVHPDRQGKGRGGALIRHIEHTLAAQGGRMLIVETAGVESFTRTRAFYRKCRFDEEARIRDFYDAGVDKMVFRKLLA